MSMGYYLHAKLTELRAEELEREARLEALRAEARRAAAGRAPWTERLLSAVHLLPARPAGDQRRTPDETQARRVGHPLAPYSRP
jgi:hypothetical protein